MEWIINVAAGLAGAVIGVVGGWLLTRRQNREDAFDDVIERVLIGIAEFIVDSAAWDIERPRLMFKALRREDSTPSMRQPSALPVSISLEILEMRAAPGRRQTVSAVAAAWGRMGLDSDPVDRLLIAESVSSALKLLGLRAADSDVLEQVAGLGAVLAMHRRAREGDDDSDS